VTGGSVLSRALLLNGTCGAGKSTVGAAVAELLADAGVAVGFVDLDALGVAWPRPPGDPFHKALAARNLAGVAADLVDVGVRSLVLSGVVVDEADLARYEEALGLPITVVRLVVPLGVLDDRLRHRHGDADPGGLDWHRSRAPELDAQLDRSPVPMAAVANTAPVATVARAVLAACGWSPGG
jgi:chloramphenicol 3-O-phosphotransferase